jgi:hypothetical protein
MLLDLDLGKTQAVLHGSLDGYPDPAVQDALLDLDLILEVAAVHGLAEAVGQARLIMITDAMLLDAFEAPSDDL